MSIDSPSWYVVRTAQGPLLFEKQSRSVEQPLSAASISFLESFIGKKAFAPIEMDQLDAAGVLLEPSGSLCHAERPTPLISAFRVVLTEGCDYGCSYCFEGELHKRPKSMTDETLAHVLNAILDASRRHPVSIQWFGGEPLLHVSKIQSAVEWLATRGPHDHPIKHIITTHGGLVSDEIAKFFKKAGFFVWVSIDGPESLHDQARRTKKGDGTHAAASRAIKLLVSSGVDVGALVTAGPHNMLSLHQLPAYFKSTFGIRSVAVNSPQPVGDRWTVDGGMFARELYRMAQAACLHGVELTSKLGKVQQLLSTDAVFLSDCAAADGSMGVSIGPDGVVSPCIVEWRNLKDASVSLATDGSLHSQTLMDWKLSSSKHEECRSCVAENVCGGPCPLEAKYSDRLNVDRCRFYQTMVVESVRRARA